MLFCYFSHQEAKSIPSPWIWAWLVNCFDQDEAKLTLCDFCAQALEPWATNWKKKPNSLACWREGTGSQRPQGMTEHRKRDPGSHNQCSHPSRISRHASHTSLMPATPSQVAPANTCGPEASHCHCALTVLQNCEQKNGGRCFKLQSFESFIMLQ